MVHAQFIKPSGKRSGHVIHVLRMAGEEEARAVSSFKIAAVDQLIKMTLGTVHYLQRGWYRREMDWVKEIS